MGTKQTWGKGAVEEWRSEETDAFSQSLIVSQMMPSGANFWPTRSLIAVSNPDHFPVGSTIQIDIQGGVCANRKVLRKDDNVLTLESPLNRDPVVGGFIYKVVDYRFDYINRQKTEALEKKLKEEGLYIQ